MKKAKKLLITLLILTFVLSTVSVGFASPMTDKIQDKDVAKAVARLEAFGIVNGMEDGQYHPELDVTREQFAKLVVEALGLGDAAVAAQGKTQFTDVAADRWSSGYINVAVGQGIIKGMGNGIFAPAEKVTYAQALTMLVRALGYKDEFLPGNWPGNYVAKAAALNITKGVSFDASGAANRGAVAVMLNNTLDAKVITVSTYEGSLIKYTESDKTLLEDKLNIDKYEDLRLIENNRINDSLKDDEVRFVATEDNVKFLNEVKDEGGLFKATVKEGINTEVLLGMKVKVYVNDDDDVIYIEPDGSQDVYVDAVNQIEKDNGNYSDIYLYKLDDGYNFADGAKVYITGIDKDVDPYTVGNGSNGTTKEENLPITAGMFGKFVLENDKIVYADLFAADQADGLVVTKVDTSNKEIEGILGTDDSFVVDLEDDYDNYIIFSSDFKPLKLEDIKADDVLYVAKQNIDGDDYAIVFVVKDNVIEGSFDESKYDSVKISGKSYDLVVNYGDTQAQDEFKTTFSSNNNDNIYYYNDSSEGYEQDGALADMDEMDVKALTDIVGRVLFITCDAKATSGSLYGVVTKTYADQDRVKIYLPKEDKEVVYEYEDTDDNALIPQNLDGKTPSFIKFKLNKDGQIAEGKLEVKYIDSNGASKYVYYDANGNIVTDADTNYAVDTEFGKDYIKTLPPSKVFSVEDDTVLIDAPNFDANNFDSGDLAPVKWADIAEDNANGVTFLVFDNSKGKAEAVLFTGAGIGAASDDYEAAYIVDTWYKGSDKMAKVNFYDGGVKDLVVDSGSKAGVVDEIAAVVKVQSDGELELVGKALNTPYGDFEIVSGKVYDKDGYYISLDAGNTVYYKASSSTVVYDDDDLKSYSNVSEGKLVDLVIENGKDIRVIKIK